MNAEQRDYLKAEVDRVARFLLNIQHSDKQAACHALKQQGLSNAKIGRRLGVSKSTVCRWLRK